jgi:hypothetical protein
MVMLLVSMTGRAMTPPRSGFVQLGVQHGLRNAVTIFAKKRKNAAIITPPVNAALCAPTVQYSNSRQSMKSTLIIPVLMLIITSCANNQRGNLTLERAFPNKQMQNFLEAVTDDKFDKADRYLSQGIDINVIGGEGISPLLWVTGSEYDIDQIEYMLKNGANPNYVEAKRKVSAMYFASGGNREDVLRLLLKYNGDPNIEAPNNDNLLMHAITQQREEYFDLLINSGLDINWHNKHNSSAPSHAIGVYGRYDWAIYFIEKGYNSNFQALASTAEGRPVSENMQKDKEKLIDILKTKDVTFPASIRVKQYLEKHTVTDLELQELIYGRKLTLD